MHRCCARRNAILLPALTGRTIDNSEGESGKDPPTPSELSKKWIHTSLYSFSLLKTTGKSTNLLASQYLALVCHAYSGVINLANDYESAESQEAIASECASRPPVGSWLIRPWIGENGNIAVGNQGLTAYMCLREIQ